MSRIIAPQWGNRRKRGQGLTREKVRRLSRTARFPDHVSGLELFVDARSLDLSDTDSVSSWPDLSDNGNDLSQGTGSAQPTYRESGINGRPAVEFDGSDDFLLSTALGSEWSGNPAAPITLAAVVEWQATDSDGVIASPVNSGDDDPLYLLREFNGNWLLQRRGDSGGSPSQITGSSIDTNPHVVIAQQEPPRIMSLRVDGAQDTRDIDTTSQGQITFDQFSVGATARTTTSLFADVRIGILLAYTGFLTCDDLDLVEHFLADAYGVAI